MSLAVLLTAFGGVGIGLLAVIHQTLRIRAVRNSDVRTDFSPEESVPNREEFVATRIVAEVEAPMAADADLDELLARTKTAIKQGRIAMAEHAIKSHYVQIKKSTSPAGAQLVKLGDQLYHWRYKKGPVETVVVAKPYPPGAGKRVMGRVYESIPSPPRRDPAAPAQATDRPSRTR